MEEETETEEPRGTSRGTHDSVGEMFDRTLRINGIDPEGVIRVGSSLRVQFYI